MNSHRPGSSKTNGYSRENQTVHLNLPMLLQSPGSYFEIKKVVNI
jgi:hypothetical protein